MHRAVESDTVRTLGQLYFNLKKIAAIPDTKEHFQTLLNLWYFHTFNKMDQILKSPKDFN